MSRRAHEPAALDPEPRQKPRSSPAVEGKLPAAVILATHYRIDGHMAALEDYLRPLTQALITIGHPLESGSNPSYRNEYSQGRLIQRIERRAGQGPTKYLAELYATVRWARVLDRPNLFVGGDSLMALAGIWLRRQRLVSAVLLYTVDYVPKRFSNPLMNRIYHLINAFAARHADIVWSVSPEIRKARKEACGAGRDSHEIIVPIGAYFHRIRRVPLAEAHPYRLVFLGHLLEKQGLQVVIEALPWIRKRVPAVCLMVIGDGPYISTLKELVGRLDVEAAVDFRGFIKDHRQIEDLIARSALAVATYTPDPRSFTRYADPGKLRNYLACGLPIVMTRVPPIAAVVAAQGAGRIVAYEPRAVADVVVDYLANPALLDDGRAAASRMASRFDWGNVFTDAWMKTLPLISPSLPNENPA
jgi:glycosyltransferase involved in cell wall biosynthesis